MKLDSQERLSEMLELTRGAVGNWELGKGAKTENLAKLADFAGVQLNWLAFGKGPKILSDATQNEDSSPIEIPIHSSPQRVFLAPNATVQGEIPRSPVKIPLYGSAVGGEDGQFVLNGNALDYVFAPPSLSGIQKAYAVQISGDSMSPRYDDGDSVSVNPDRRVRTGDYVIAQIHLEEHSPPLAYVKKLKRWTEKELILEQFNPPKELKFDGAQVASVHYVLRPGE
ncbi:helix-turn-helix transcriptional regulator [Rhizobium sp. 2MFCol3.1]|uniref:S24 family peptidase n=1 Tax=Rhizobium sp. 2MFCol3.1 TaxID=1246459 RepID=UPI001FD9334A|nr:helix-turn-helix transcriptional regulator [Rhizobium sp. 2MFCol3.1]